MKLTQAQLHGLSEAAIQAATEAGQFIQSCCHPPIKVQNKKGGESYASQVVTEVDFKAQEIILEHLNASVQSYDLGLLTEESIDDQSRLTKDYFWCIDPLDGTLPFTEQRPGYAVSIALVSKAADSEIGVVYLPDQQKCYSAVKGAGVQLNGEPYVRKASNSDQQLHWYMDRSFRTDSRFEEISAKMEIYAEQQQLELKVHASFGAVVNAVGVMASEHGCYFKLPKPREGGGSIWDYAATRLFFEELELPVYNASGQGLHLNDQRTTFMNQQGVLYASGNDLIKFLEELIRNFQ